MVSFLSIWAVFAFILRSAYATPRAEGDVLDKSLVKRATVKCDSQNAVLQALRDPKVSDAAGKFCSSYIQSSTTTTTVTTNTTSYILTQTVTPAPVVVTQTNTTCVRALSVPTWPRHEIYFFFFFFLLISLQFHYCDRDRHWSCQAMGSRKTSTERPASNLCAWVPGRSYQRGLFVYCHPCHQYIDYYCYAACKRYHNGGTFHFSSMFIRGSSYADPHS